MWLPIVSFGCFENAKKKWLSGLAVSCWLLAVLAVIWKFLLSIAPKRVPFLNSQKWSEISWKMTKFWTLFWKRASCLAHKWQQKNVFPLLSSCKPLWKIEMINKKIAFFSRQLEICSGCQTCKFHWNGQAWNQPWDCLPYPQFFEKTFFLRIVF